MSASPQLLPYARRDSSAPCFPQSLVIWGLAVGVLAIGQAMIAVLVNDRTALDPIADIRYVLHPGEDLLFGHWSQILISAKFYTQVIAGMLVLIVSVRHALRPGVLNTPSRYLLRTAAIVLLLRLPAETACVVSVRQFVREFRTIDVVLGTWDTLVAAAIPSLVLFVISMRRFTDSPTFARRATATVVLVWLVTSLSCVTIFPSIDWVTGRVPWWFSALGPRSQSYFRTEEEGLVTLLALAGQFALYPLQALAAGVVMSGLRLGGGRRIWFLLFAILWAIAATKPLAQDAIGIGFRTWPWTAAYRHPLAYCFDVLLAVVLLDSLHRPPIDPTP